MSGTNNIFPGGANFPTSPAPALPQPTGGMGGQFGQPQINQLSGQFHAPGGAPNTLPPFLTGQQNVLGGPANGAAGMPGGGNPNLAMFGQFANMPLQPPGAMMGQPGGMPGMAPQGGAGQNSNLMALFAALQNHPQLNAALNPANIPNATQFQPPAQPQFTAPPINPTLFQPPPQPAAPATTLAPSAALLAQLGNNPSGAGGNDGGGNSGGGSGSGGGASGDSSSAF